MLSEEEYRRYSRQMLLAEVGYEGQSKLKEARVLCVGAGGLGSPVLLYLAAAGIGTLGIIDFDRVEISNLHRQIIYTRADILQRKAVIAKNRMMALNPHIEVNTYDEKFTSKNALACLSSYDIVADCSDNFSTRYLVNDAAFHLKKPNVSASIFKFEGQCSVFTAGEGPCYRCLYPAHPPKAFVPTCSEVGVFGMLPGMLGTIQATEIIKWILKIGDGLIGRLLTVDARSMQFREFQFKRNPDCVLCGQGKSFESLVYSQEEVCMNQPVPEISVDELKEWQAQKKDFLLLDVRELKEYEECEMGGKLIPLGDLQKRINELDPLRLTVVHCKGGGRSKRAVELLKSAGFADVRNLTGGITAWLKA